MSLVNPSTRWWNSLRNRRRLAWVSWVISIGAFVATGWLFETMDGAKVAILFPLGMITMLGGEFLYLLGSDPDDDFNPRVVFFPLAALFIAQGVGQSAHGIVHGQEVATMAAIFVGVGVLTLIVVEVVSRRLEGNRVVAADVMRGGIRTQGTVTRARGYYLNEARVTRVTVEFTDHTGRQRWASQTVGGAVRVGERLSVQYLPEELHRKACVVIGGD